MSDTPITLAKNYQKCILGLYFLRQMCRSTYSADEISERIRYEINYKYMLFDLVCSSSIILDVFTFENYEFRLYSIIKSFLCKNKKCRQRQV